MGETGRDAIHSANLRALWHVLGTLWGQDSKVPVCRELPVLRVRQTSTNKYNSR